MSGRRSRSDGTGPQKTAQGPSIIRERRKCLCGEKSVGGSVCVERSLWGKGCGGKGLLEEVSVGKCVCARNCLREEVSMGSANSESFPQAQPRVTGFAGY